MQMQGAEDMLFPSSGMRVLSAFVHFAGVSVLAHCLSRRVAAEHLSSLAGLSQLSLARTLILLTLLDSWLFLFTSGMVIFGAGLESSGTACSLGIYLCIIFYASSKALIYFFLVEKMHIVWAPIAGTRRMKSPVYLFTMVVLSGYGVIIVLLFVGRIAKFRDDGVCLIGLGHLASIPLISYDLLTNVLLTGLFLWPLWRSPNLNARVKRIAARTTIAALVALATSTVNMLVLTLMHGEQLGWVCLGSCGADVIVNAIALFWVTTGPNDESARSRSDGLPPRASAKAQGEGVVVYRVPPPSAKAPRFDKVTRHAQDQSGRDSGASVFERSKVPMDTIEDGEAVILPEVNKDQPSQPPYSATTTQNVTHSSPPSPSTPGTPGVRRPLIRSRSSRNASDGYECPPPSGMARFLGMFRTNQEDERTHELQITVTRNFDIHTDFKSGEVDEVQRDITSRRASRHRSEISAAVNAV